MTSLARQLLLQLLRRFLRQFLRQVHFPEDPSSQRNLDMCYRGHQRGSVGRGCGRGGRGGHGGGGGITGRVGGCCHVGR